MAISPKDQLIRRWIQYLKNNRIVELNSDPSTGKLKYRKQVTKDILINFLRKNSSFNIDVIDDVVNSVINKGITPQSGGTPPGTSPQPGGTPPQPGGTPPGTSPQSGGTPPTETPQLGKGGTPPGTSTKPGKEGTSPTETPQSNTKRHIDPEEEKKIQYIYKITGGKGLVREPDDTFSATIQDPKNPENDIVLYFDKDYNFIKKKVVGPGNVDKKSKTEESFRFNRSANRLQFDKLNSIFEAIRISQNSLKLKEDFKDVQSPQISEKDVEDIFDKLLSMQVTDTDTDTDDAEDKKDTDTDSEEEQLTPEEKKEAELEKIKSIILNKMNPETRRLFWNLLQGHSTITEATIQRDDVKRLFREFHGKIDINDLEKEWKRYGSPTDTDRISYFLNKKFGLSRDTIERAFIEVLGDNYDNDDNDDNDDDEESDEEFRERDRKTKEAIDAKRKEVLEKMVKYIADNGLLDDIKQFMMNEFGEELEEPKQKPDFFSRFFREKLEQQEVMQIFNVILNEEKLNNSILIAKTEKYRLGRISKDSRERINEAVELNDVLKSDQYIRLLRNIKTRSKKGINVTRIKNNIIRSWKRGLRSRKHYNKLLSHIDLNLKDLIKK